MRIVGGLKNSKEADAVLLHEYVRENRPPDTAHQIWIYHSLESADNRNLNDFAHIVNWTATYRWDSDIVTPYGRFVPHYENFLKIFRRDERVTHFDKFVLREDWQPSNELMTKVRNKLSGNDSTEVLWMVSNCRTTNSRENYVANLRNFILVETIGLCGKKGCPKWNSCQDSLLERSLFYLAFENSNCRGYITEKFFSNALNHNVVPVVMGGSKEDYTKVAPPNSFIHVEDFQSARSLASHLKFLMKNPLEYSKYFAWKGTGEFIDTKFFCRMCSMLNAPVISKSYLSLAGWWNGPGACRGPVHPK